MGKLFQRLALVEYKQLPENVPLHISLSSPPPFSYPPAWSMSQDLAPTFNTKSLTIVAMASSKLGCSVMILKLPQPCKVCICVEASSIVLPLPTEKSKIYLWIILGYCHLVLSSQTEQFPLHLYGYLEYIHRVTVCFPWASFFVPDDCLAAGRQMERNHAFFTF